MLTGKGRWRQDRKRRLRSPAPGWRRTVVLTLLVAGIIGAGIGAKVMRDRAAHATQPGWVIIGPHEDGGLW